MTRESTKENKPAGFKSLISVLKPIRDWLKSTPPVIHVQSTASNNITPTTGTLHKSSATPNGLSSKSAIVHNNHLLGNGAVEFNTHLMRQQQQQIQQQQQQQQFLLTPQPPMHVQYQQQLYSQPIYQHHQQLVAQHQLAPPLPPPPLPRPRPIIGHQQQATPVHYYSTTPMSMLNSNTSSTPISSPNNNTNSSSRDDNSLYMVNNNTTTTANNSVTLHRRTPIFNGLGEAQDDFNASSGGLNAVEEQFKRNAKSRMSLPIMQQSKLRRQAYNQLQKRGQPVAQSLGHIYLQHKGETKQASLPNELTAIDTIRALFVCAFPNLLTMEYMSQPHVKIYIYNPSCNIFYELRDIDDVKHESVLRIHQSDPILAFQPPPKPRRMIPANHLIYGIPHQNLYNHHPQAN